LNFKKYIFVALLKCAVLDFNTLRNLTYVPLLTFKKSSNPFQLTTILPKINEKNNNFRDIFKDKHKYKYRYEDKY